MARFRTSIYFFLAAALLLIPSATFAAGYFGPIIPQSGSCFCDGGPLDWGCVLQVIQNLIRLAVSLGVIMCVVWTAWGGFSLILSRGNPEAISTAKTRFLNSLIGIAVILCSWIIVNFIMVALYNPDAAFSGRGIGPWNDILAGNGDDYCIRATTPQYITTGALTSILPSAAAPIGNTGTPGNSGVGACNASTIAELARQGGANMSAAEANTIACFAGPESGCGTQMQNYNWDAAHRPPPSTAYGPFQITLKGNSRCFNNPTCSQAAGVSGPLNCDQAFTSRGYSIPGDKLNRCRTAAANLACSAVAAHCVYEAAGPRAWSGNRDSTSAHQACASNSGR